ncbi:hypothetical protein BD779DRAFT_1678641 [Infundibulicybe gibba]|nr:hypothetical protein BD779DRAFT_1678641 [Infundibulicybe gibba]
MANRPSRMWVDVPPAPYPIPRSSIIARNPAIQPPVPNLNDSDRNPKPATTLGKRPRAHESDGESDAESNFHEPPLTRIKPTTKPRQHCQHLRYEDKQGKYYLDDRTCAHTGSINFEDISAPEHPLAAHKINKSCVVLEVFNLGYHEGFRMLFCELHKSFIPFSRLSHHLEDKHRRTIPRGMKLLSTIPHISTAFGLNVEQDFGDLIKYPSVVHPIPFLEIPELSVQCHQLGCRMWTKVAPKDSQKGPLVNIRQHYRKFHNIPTANVPESLPWEYTQKPFNGIASGSHLEKNIIVRGWLPTAPEPNRPHEVSQEQSFSADLDAHHDSTNIDTPVYETYLDKLGWRDAISSRDCWNQLLELVMLPSIGRYSNPKKKALESSLILVHQFLRVYLQEANQFVSECHIAVRQQLTTG